MSCTDLLLVYITLLLDEAYRHKLPNPLCSGVTVSSGVSHTDGDCQSLKNS